jgi:hypothetical protein
VSHPVMNFDRNLSGLAGSTEATTPAKSIWPRVGFRLFRSRNPARRALQGAGGPSATRHEAKGSKLSFRRRHPVWRLPTQKYPSQAAKQPGKSSRRDGCEKPFNRSHTCLPGQFNHCQSSSLFGRSPTDRQIKRSRTAKRSFWSAGASTSSTSRTVRIASFHSASSSRSVPTLSRGWRSFWLTSKK